MRSLRMDWRNSTAPGVTERTTTGFSLPATKPNPRTGSRLISTRRGTGGTPSRGTSSRELLCDTWLKQTGQWPQQRDDVYYSERTEMQSDIFEAFNQFRGPLRPVYFSYFFSLMVLIWADATTNYVIAHYRRPNPTSGTMGNVNVLIQSVLNPSKLNFWDATLAKSALINPRLCWSHASPNPPPTALTRWTDGPETSSSICL